MSVESTSEVMNDYVDALLKQEDFGRFFAEDVVSLRDYVTEIDADPKPDSPLGSQIRVPVDHPALDFRRTAHRIDHARKFHQ